MSQNGVCFGAELFIFAMIYEDLKLGRGVPEAILHVEKNRAILNTIQQREQKKSGQHDDYCLISQRWHSFIFYFKRNWLI